jgi:hypothetical protein
MTLLLNTSGSELIYETPGDAERGNPLDIITVAECYSCEDVTGLAEFEAKETAERMALCWNTHDDLVTALKLYDAWTALPADRGGSHGTKGRAHAAFIAAKDAALAKAKG